MPTKDTASSTAYRTARLPVLVFAALRARACEHKPILRQRGHALAMCTESLVVWYFCSSSSCRMTCCRLRSVLRMGCS